MKPSRFLFLSAVAFGVALSPLGVGQAHARPLTVAQFVEAEGAGAEPEFADHAAEECAHILATGSSVDDCQKAPSPILPETNEIIWGGISFVVVVIALAFFAVPALQKGMTGRSDRIASDLQSAEATKASADTMLADYKAQLADARTESNRIIDEARQQADAVRKDLLARAEADAATVRAKATEDLNLQVERIKVDLQSHVKSLSLELAEKVVGANLNNETNAALIDRYIAELSAR